MRPKPTGTGSKTNCRTTRAAESQLPSSPPKEPARRLVPNALHCVCYGDIWLKTRRRGHHLRPPSRQDASAALALAGNGLPAAGHSVGERCGFASKRSPGQLVLPPQLRDPRRREPEPIGHVKGPLATDKGPDQLPIPPGEHPQPLLKVDAEGDGVGNRVLSVGDSQLLPVIPILL